MRRDNNENKNNKSERLYEKDSWEKEKDKSERIYKKEINRLSYKEINTRGGNRTVRFQSESRISYSLPEHKTVDIRNIYKLNYIYYQ